jgi:hypothetical protein
MGSGFDAVDASLSRIVVDRRGRVQGAVAVFLVDAVGIALNQAHHLVTSPLV